MKDIVIRMSILILFSGFVTSCCDCFDPAPAIEVKYEKFTKEELMTFYLISNNLTDTIYNFIDTSANSSTIMVGVKSKYIVQSDSIPLSKVIFIEEIDVKRTFGLFCRCIKSMKIIAKCDGKTFINEPIVITK